MQKSCTQKPQIDSGAQGDGSKPRLAVLCVGNILMLDEGVAPRLAAELNVRFTFLPAVDVLDRATMGMALLTEISSYDTVLLVDAVDNTGLEPGTVVSFEPEDIASYEAFHGAHDTRFIDVLQTAALLGYQVDAHCRGIQIANMSPAQYQVGLTPAVEEALPLLIHSVLVFLSEYGVEITDRTTGQLWAGERVEPMLDATDLASAAWQQNVMLHQAGSDAIKHHC